MARNLKLHLDTAENQTRREMLVSTILAPQELGCSSASTQPLVTVWGECGLQSDMLLYLHESGTCLLLLSINGMNTCILKAELSC